MFRPSVAGSRPVAGSRLVARSWLAALVSGLFCGTSHAHHEPGHTPSESLRNLTALGGDPNPRQRVALLSQVVRGTDEPTLNSATAYSLSALVDIQIHRRLYVGAQLPTVLIDEDSTSAVKVGYGDTIFGINVPLGRLRRGSPNWVVGVSASFPTRTFRYESDPGKQWLIAPALRYGDSLGSFLWYAILVVPVETRPAGTAVDLGTALGVGYRFFGKFSVTGGMNADIRALTVCKLFDGSSEICSEGRVTETDRAQGRTRLYAHTALSLDLSRRWSIFAGGQLPLSTHRDIEWALHLGVEARF